MGEKLTYIDKDVVIVGAGFSGLYMLHSLRELGLSATVYERGEEVGGTWYWNTYPGAQCDTEAMNYCYSFSDEIVQEWTWTARYPKQKELLDYLNFVADRLDLRKNIVLNTNVTSAEYDEELKIWRVNIDDGSVITCKYFITAVGGLSVANIPHINGLDNFKGEWYHTGEWPKEEIDFTGKRVGVIGTGSSGVQVISEIAKEVEHLTVFQRTPGYVLPANDFKYEEDALNKVKADYESLRTKMKSSFGGLPWSQLPKSSLEDSAEERNKVYEAAWKKGGSFIGNGTYNDFLTNEESNKTVSDFIRSKIREIVKNPETAEKLIPDFHFATKRTVVGTNYYETFNRENVSLVSVLDNPIQEITENGIKTNDIEYELDVIIFATGYDAITGPLLKMDITGKRNLTLKEKWRNKENVSTYLGVAHAGFPNMFSLLGPQSPDYFTNAPVAIEQRVEWIRDLINYCENNEIDIVEPKVEAEKAWNNEVKEVLENSLLLQTDSWWTGGNLKKNSRSYLVYVGGFNRYAEYVKEIASENYKGFSLTSLKETSITLNT